MVWQMDGATLYAGMSTASRAGRCCPGGGQRRDNGARARELCLVLSVCVLLLLLFFVFFGGWQRMRQRRHCPPRHPTGGDRESRGQTGHPAEEAELAARAAHSATSNMATKAMERNLEVEHIAEAQTLRNNSIASHSFLE